MRGDPKGHYQKGSLTLGIEGVGFMPDARWMQDHKTRKGFYVANLLPKWKPRHWAGVLQDEFAVTDGPAALIRWTSLMPAVQVKTQDMVTGVVVVRLSPHTWLVMHGDATSFDF